MLVSIGTLRRFQKEEHIYKYKIVNGARLVCAFMLSSSSKSVFTLPTRFVEMLVSKFR